MFCCRDLYRIISSTLVEFFSYFSVCVCILYNTLGPNDIFYLRHDSHYILLEEIHNIYYIIYYTRVSKRIIRTNIFFFSFLIKDQKNTYTYIYILYDRIIYAKRGYYGVQIYSEIDTINLEYFFSSFPRWVS